jgi:predicted secreted protein
MPTDTRSNSFDGDTHGRKVVFVANCVPNRAISNRTVTLASQPPAIRAVIRIALDHDVEVVQMPCPERTCYFAQRWGGVRSDFDTPAFRRRCQVFAEQVLDQVMAYQATGREVVGIVMRDGSPTCGLTRSCVAADSMPAWSGMIWQVPQQRFADTEGVFSEILQAEARRRGLEDLHMLAAPEAPTPDASESLVEIRRAMGSIKTDFSASQP